MPIVTLKCLLYFPSSHVLIYAFCFIHTYRMFKEGICLALIEEYDKILDDKPYSVLPLVRLCEEDGQVAQSLLNNCTDTHLAITSLAERMLRRVADKPKEGQQVMSRPGLNVDTVDDEGRLILCRPINEAKAALNNATNNKGVKVSHIKCLLTLIYKLQSIIYLQFDSGNGLRMSRRLLQKGNSTSLHWLSCRRLLLKKILFCRSRTQDI